MSLVEAKLAAAIAAALSSWSAGADRP